MLRRAAFALACVATLALAPVARAQITEPNGLVVPGPSSTPSETSLASFFSAQGEAIDWIADAHATPDVFSPLCGFTATFVLNEAGSHFGLAWYNADGLSAAPAPGDLHLLVPAGSAVGTSFTGTSIRMDPAYTGGHIGFALVGGETHYSQRQWNNLCSGCSTPAPWVTALIYQSTTTPNAYYVGFEDGGTSASTWNNDGDFNDDVFFITGVTCSGGGAACDTGMLGVCAEGVQQCTDGGSLSCVPVVPSSTEVCNAVDDDCNGTVDDGSGLCATDFVCDHGTCVHACNGGEFACNGGLACSADGFCVDPACATVTCPAGSVCHAGVCRAPCDGVTCPFGSVCRIDRCVDPCATVTCPSGQSCDAGVCRESCTCSPCATGLSCDATSGRCLDPACATTTCGAGTHCAGGTCVDDCAGATCPPGQLCTAGGCVADPCASVTCTGGMVCSGGTCVDPCAGVTCPSGQICEAGACVVDLCAGVTCPAGSHCVGGSCALDGVDGGAGGGDAGAGGLDGGRGTPSGAGGCCSVIGNTPARGVVLLGLVLVALLARRRRQR